MAILAQERENGWRPTHTHLALAVLVAIVLPAAPSFGGPRWLGWTMYTNTASYRLHVTVFEADGGARSVPPTELARRAGPEVGIYLAGADHWRFAPVGPALRARVGELASLACLVWSGAAVEVTLDERSTFDSPVHGQSARLQCSH